MNILKKILIIFITILLIKITLNPVVSSSGNINKDQKIIDEYTWSFLKYDTVVKSRNHGTIYTPKPMVGSLLVLSNMMLEDVCRHAISLYDEDRMQLMINIKNFCIKNMKIFLFDYYKSILKYKLFSRFSEYYYSSSRATTEEMNLLGNRLITNDWYYGLCYDQACFVTAVLRLCGVPPEDVFNIIVPFHAFTVVKVDDNWYAFDSAKGQSHYLRSFFYDINDAYIYDKVNSKNYFSTLENDRYYINFLSFEEEINLAMQANYSNMDSSLLIDIIPDIQRLMNNSNLGSEDCNLYDFVNNSTPYHGFDNISIPYTIKDATGDNLDEKAINLSRLVKTFIENQSGEKDINQYNRCIYSLGVFPVKYPQAYANAAKFGATTANYAAVFDACDPYKDVKKTVSWINLVIKTKDISECNHVFHSDFIYRIKKGSTIDKALVSYGTLRNMKKNENFWQEDDLYVIVTSENKGYLAVNSKNKGWVYLNFDKGPLIVEKLENISFAFNEKVKLDNWNN